MRPSSREPYSRADALCVVDILGDRHRNRALRLLRSHGTPMSLDTLAERIDASSENANAEERDTPRRRTVVELHHTHLPKLDEAGVIDYDRDSKMVVWFDEERLDALVETGQRVLESLQKNQSRSEEPLR